MKINWKKLGEFVKDLGLDTIDWVRTLGRWFYNCVMAWVIKLFIANWFIYIMKDVKIDGSIVDVSNTLAWVFVLIYLVIKMQKNPFRYTVDSVSISLSKKVNRIFNLKCEVSRLKQEIKSMKEEKAL